MLKFIKKAYLFVRNKYYMFSVKRRIVRLAKEKVQDPSFFLNLIFGGNSSAENIVTVKSVDGMSLRGKASDIGVVSEVWVLDDYAQDPTFRIKSGDMVFDIGAHIGAFSVYAASKGAKVYAFEPLEQNYQQLLENIALNNFQDRITPFNKGIFSKTGRVPFAISHENSGGGSVIRADGNSGQAFIETVTLGEICAQLGIESIDLVKMDIEGSEYIIWENISPDEAKRIKKIVGEYHLFPFKPAWNFYYLKRLLKPYFSQVKKHQPYYFYAKK